MASGPMEQLIRDLNSPQNQGKPEKIHQIQKQLQRLQSDPSAWQGSLDLLSRDDNILRFYGALTLSLKINADWEKDKIGEDRDLLSQLMKQLVTTYVNLAATGGGTDLVISKLSQVLAAVFAKPDSAWAYPCRHVLACLLTGRYLQQTQIPSVAELLTVKAVLPAYSLKAVLRLALALHEDIAANSHNHINHRSHVHLSNNAVDVWQIINFTLTSFFESGQTAFDRGSSTSLTLDWSKSQPRQVLQEALQQVQHWMKYLTTESNHSSMLFSLFQNSMQKIFTLFDHTDISTDAIACVTAVQNEDDRLLLRAVPNYITLVNNANIVKHWMWQASLGEYSDGLTSYVEFLESVISHVDATTDSYLKVEGIAIVLQNAVALLSTPGAAVVDDPICHSLLEIMTTVAEGYSDWPDASPLDQEMLDLLKNICAAIFKKVRYPLDELDKQTKTWDQDEFTMFEDFRFDASDFFQTAFGIVGPDLVMDLIVPTSASNQDWTRFESILFVLTCVTDALSNEPQRCDPCLTQLFDSPMWAKGVNASEQIPSLVRLAMIKLLGESTSFLQRHPQHLLSSLDFLFRSLQIRNHAGPASKAIFNLCDKQRTFLAQGLAQFLATLTTIDHIPLHSRLRILSAVASLIQALDAEDEKIEPLHKMLLLLHNKMANNSDSITNTQDEEPPDPYFEHLSMLAAIAKGLQSPSDVPIDLESTDSKSMVFWTEGPGQQIQKGVLQMIAESWSRLLSPSSSDLVTAACDFLKAGFKEEHPSPFKFDINTTIQLLSPLIDHQNPNLDQTMGATACYVASMNASILSPSQTGADIILPRVIKVIGDATTILTAENNNISIDPTTTDSVTALSTSTPSFAAPTSPLDFLVRIFQRGKWGIHLFTSQSAPTGLSTIVEYSLLLLRGTDTLPRRSAALFFTALLDLTDPSAPLHTHPIASQNLSHLLQTYSPNVLGLITHLLAGECARSEVETLSETLRKFIQRQPMPAKRILQEAMKPESGVLAVKALQATKPEQRARFVSQVEALRGAKRTNEIVREFWTACRGAQFGYVT